MIVITQVEVEQLEYGLAWCCIVDLAFISISKLLFLFLICLMKIINDLKIDRFLVVTSDIKI